MTMTFMMTGSNIIYIFTLAMLFLFTSYGVILAKEDKEWKECAGNDAIQNILQ